MLSASSRLLQFDEINTQAEFSGNRHLIEYTVGDVKLDFENHRDFAVLFVEGKPHIVNIRLNYIFS